jgi:hypothetical protein
MTADARELSPLILAVVSIEMLAEFASEATDRLVMEFL